MTDLLKELQWRGFVQEATPRIDAHLAQEPVIDSRMHRACSNGFRPCRPTLGTASCSASA